MTPPAGERSKLATAWFITCVVVTLPFVWVVGALVMLVTMPFDPHRHAMQRWVNGCCHQYLRCWPGWRVRVTGREHLPKGPFVMVANHQSAADIWALLGLGVPYTFVSKASMFKIPFIGWMMGWMGHIALQRDRRDSVKQMLRACEERLAQGEPVLIFPEGTYASGPLRLPFRRGAFHLAQHAQVPLVPVVIRGTLALIFEDGPLFASRGDVHVEVMPPIAPPAPHDVLGPCIADVQARFSAWLGQPFAPSPGRSARAVDGDEAEPGVR
jgi:1-acyl-sn-glycerol-3-phosphate acyltransferase